MFDETSDEKYFLPSLDPRPCSGHHPTLRTSQTLTNIFRQDPHETSFRTRLLKSGSCSRWDEDGNRVSDENSGGNDFTGLFLTSRVEDVSLSPGVCPRRGNRFFVWRHSRVLDGPGVCSSRRYEPHCQRHLPHTTRILLDRSLFNE